MAILAALFAFGSKFVGKILTTALGWASTLLFGRVPQSRQFLLLGITFGSVIWMVLLVGRAVPRHRHDPPPVHPAAGHRPRRRDPAAHGARGDRAARRPRGGHPRPDARGRPGRREGRSRPSLRGYPVDVAPVRPPRLPRRPGHLAQGLEPGEALDRRPRAPRREAGRLRAGRGRPRSGRDRRPGWRSRRRTLRR